MTIAVPNQWIGTAGDADMQRETLPTSGSWMIVVVSWRVVDGSSPQVTVADLARNLWTLLGTSDHPTAATHIQVWACPKALYDGWSTLSIHISAMDISALDNGSVSVNAFEVTGLSDAMTIDSVVVATASSSTTLSMVVPTPAGGANCLMVAGAAVDNATATLSVTSSGWTPLTQAGTSNPGIKMGPAWRTGTATQTPAWSSAVAVNWVGIAVSIRETGVPVPQPNPNYPAVQMQLGLGYDTSTPLQAVSYTPIVGDHLSTSTSRGIQAELGSAQSEPTDLEFLDVNGGFASRPVVSATLNASGTTTTATMSDAQAAGLVKGDWFRLWTSSGVLKETAVFRITAIPTSVAGTTTVTFAPAARAATASTDVLTTTPPDIYTPYRQTATWAGKTYPVSAGWLESFKQTWPSSAYSLVDAVGVDALAMLSVASPTVLRGEILRRKPTHYWPLDDPSGAGATQNASGVSQAQLVQTKSKFGAGSGTADFGVSTQLVDSKTTAWPPTSIGGDPGSGWQQSGLASADLASKGFALVGQDSAFPPIADGVTILGMVFVQKPDLDIIQNATVDPTIMILRNNDPGAGTGQGSVLKLSIVHAATSSFLKPQMTVWDQVTHAATNTVGTSAEFQVVGFNWRVWAVTFDRTSWTVYSSGAPAMSGSANLVPTFSTIDIGGEADQFATTRFFNGLHAHVAVIPRKLSAGEIDNIKYYMRDGTISTETSNLRIQRKLAVAGWKGARVLSNSALTPSGEGTDTATVADKAAEVASYEDGLVFVDAAGAIQFRSRQQSYHQFSRATLGEDTANGEIPYTRDVSFEIDPAFIYNLVRIYNSVATYTTSTVSTSVTSDPVSAGKYRERAFERTVRLGNIADAFALACWLLARYAYPQRRISHLTIDAGVYPAAFPFVLGVEVGDLVTVVRRPTYEPVTSRLYRVLHVAHNQSGAGHWTTTLTFAIAQPPVILLGDPVKGVIGNNAIGA